VGGPLRETSIFVVLKVLRRCPLVLLVGVRRVFRINSILILMKLERLYWTKFSLALGGLH
jgi:hypothetical protein